MARVGDTMSRAASPRRIRFGGYRRPIVVLKVDRKLIRPGPLVGLAALVGRSGTSSVCDHSDLFSDRGGLRGVRLSQRRVLPRQLEQLVHLPTLVLERRRVRPDVRHDLAHDAALVVVQAREQRDDDGRVGGDDDVRVGAVAEKRGPDGDVRLQQVGVGATCGSA